MAKARVANPRKRRRRSRRRAAARRPSVRYVNPRKRRRRSRRRNPGMGGGITGALKGSVRALIPAALGGAAIGFADAKLLADKSMIVRVGAKIGAAALAGVLLRKNPMAAHAAMGAMLGTLGYEGGVRAGGGVIATSKPAGMRELAALAAEDEEALGILEAEMQGMGLLEDGVGDDDDMDGMGATPDLGDAEPDLGDIADDEDFADADSYDD